MCFSKNICTLQILYKLRHKWTIFQNWYILCSVSNYSLENLLEPLLSILTQDLRLQDLLHRSLTLPPAVGKISIKPSSNISQAKNYFLDISLVVAFLNFIFLLQLMNAKICRIKCSFTACSCKMDFPRNNE